MASRLLRGWGPTVAVVGLLTAASVAAAFSSVRVGLVPLDEAPGVAQPQGQQIQVSAPPATPADDGPDLFVLADELARRGWHTQPQLRYDALPPSIHLTVTASVAPRVARFAAALREAVDAALAAGPVPLGGDLLALAASIDPAAVTPELVAHLATGLGLVTDTTGVGSADAAAVAPTSYRGDAGGDAPGIRMAPVNTLLNAAPPAVRERLLIEFVSLLQTPHGSFPSGADRVDA